MFKRLLTFLCVMLTISFANTAMAKIVYTVDNTKEASVAAEDLNGQMYVVTDAEGLNVFNLSGWDMKPQLISKINNIDEMFPVVMFEAVTDADTDIEGNIYTLRLYNYTRDKHYAAWFEESGYLNFQPGTQTVIFALGLGESGKYGQDGKNLGIWQVTYEEGNGYVLMNVGRPNEYLSPASENPIAEKTYVRLFTELGAEDDGISVDYAEIAEGSYYIKNNESGRFLQNGAMWGTRAVLGESGIQYAISQDESGKYTLVSNVKAEGKALRPGDGFNDQSGAWELVATEGGFYMYNGSQYFSYDGTAIPQFVEEPTAASVWNVVTDEQRAADLAKAMNKASEEDPVDVSFLIKKADFMMNDPRPQAWEGGEKIGGDGSSACSLPNSGNSEKWNAGTFDFYQTVTGLKAGKYRLTVKAFYRHGGTGAGSIDAYENGTEESPVLYAGEESVKIVSVYSEAKAEKEGGWNTESKKEESETAYFIPNSQSAADACFEAGAYLNTIDGIEVNEDGTLTIGIKREGEAINDWTVFDQFHLYYLGKSSAVVNGYVEVTEEMWHEWNAYENGEIVGAVQGMEYKVGEEVGAGGVIMGTSSVLGCNYADLSQYKSIYAEGTPGNSMRLLFNRPSLEGGSAPILEIVGQFNEEGIYTLDIEEVKGKAANDGIVYPYAHLNSIKSTWSGPCTVTKFGVIDMADAIHEVTVAPVNSGVVYNLAGQKVGAGFKGIVIKNGKKMIVK